ncbi:hypothetical protein [uncultured Fibrobacter sp.]|uniref:hypothetical protein n=1 Tax=uncultured Fibrobacter sp. TaxID=261512 RepID=UPI0025F732B8|nr:hypothetical protein [uncultured Fibrobacter sp.]
MKKMLVCAAALSFALAACADDCCGDESSSGANGRKTNRYETLHVGDCDESFSHCPRSIGAFMLQGEDGGYQVLLDGIQLTSIEIDGDYYSERSGDTLSIWDDVEIHNVITLDCPVEARFDISTADADIKYLKFYGNVYEVLPADSRKTRDACLEEWN